jgi:hypothetical protein
MITLLTKLTLKENIIAQGKEFNNPKGDFAKTSAMVKEEVSEIEFILSNTPNKEEDTFHHVDLKYPLRT